MLGILSRSRRRDLGYFAPTANAPRIDLGPEFTPQQFENRQTLERGLKSFLDYSRRPPGPMATTQSDPRLKQYQESFQDLALRDPAYADELARTAGNIAVMAERRRFRPFLFGRPPKLSGLGYVMVPAPPPGPMLVDAARAGVPLDLPRRELTWFERMVGVNPGPPNLPRRRR